MDPRQQNNNSDIFALHSGGRPIEMETETNAAAIKKQRVEKQQLTPGSKLILEHLEKELVALSNPLNIDWTAVTDDELRAIQTEQIANQKYALKLERLATWIKTRVK